MVNNLLGKNPSTLLCKNFFLLRMSDGDDGKGSNPTSLEMGSKAQDLAGLKLTCKACRGVPKLNYMNLFHTFLVLVILFKWTGFFQIIFLIRLYQCLNGYTVNSIYFF